ncbi:MAG: chemotaxis protein CheW [Desulfobacteraceae bacterium]|nr:MAG: chemotaxis protein CheW [Desulfobacteraceae bacterium]
MTTDPAQRSQFLTFKLGEEIFALDVVQVREILDVAPITKVPRSPEFMRGVINVRGSVVPVVDLRLKFGLPATQRTVDTRIVVMEIALDGEMSIIGSMADAVHDVMELDPSAIEEAPKIGAKWNTEFIKGIGKLGDRFIIILDVNKVFSADELAVVRKSEPETIEAS